jgi:hypothetical protein
VAALDAIGSAAASARVAARNAEERTKPRVEVRIVDTDMDFLPIYDMHNRKSRELYQLPQELSIRQISQHSFLSLG